MDGCFGIGRVATRVPFAEQYDVHCRSSRHRATRSTKRTYFLVILNRVSPLSTLYRSHIAILQFVPCMSSGKSTLLRQGVCVKHLQRCKTSFYVWEFTFCFCTPKKIVISNLIEYCRGTIHVLCAMVQRSGHSTCGYHG